MHLSHAVTEKLWITYPTENHIKIKPNNQLIILSMKHEESCSSKQILACKEHVSLIQVKGWKYTRKWQRRDQNLPWVKWKHRQRLEEGEYDSCNLLFSFKWEIFFCSEYGVHQQKRITVTSYPGINLTDIGNLSSRRRVGCSGKILTAHERRE